MNSGNKIEDVIDNKINKSDGSKTEKNTDSETDSDKNGFKEITYLVIRLFLNVLKSPFKIFAKYLRDEFIIAIKKDAQLYALIMGIMGVLFVVFSVLWLSISVAVGVYFYEHGYSILISIIYSIGFQIVSFILIGLIAYISSKKLKSLKMMKKLANVKLDID
ncbi:hypothetical protein [Ancylomarina sp. 16SWW S1-10-2]|uniref:hypothetical protein n=1 Tax=Ancylomarina sp. 16SWW S1-10-2 TaxID=2499681 RepID=UPI0012AE4E4C|nr:hypothetical protein [Ancylomarina sp. 16SWW S1-10-2]MRT93044.1 hypothetical protein [Ancylomarina sp. 16SWW S1-10-2]